MQNFLSVHTGTPVYANANDVLPDLTGLVVQSATPSAVEAVFNNVAAVSVETALMFIAASVEHRHGGTSIDRMVTSSGCIVGTQGQFIAYSFRVELPIGTDPTTINWDTVKSAGQNMYVQPIHGDHGLNTFSWESAHQYDMRPALNGQSVYYGVVIRAFGTTAGTDLFSGVVSSREVLVDKSVYQPNK